MKHAGDKPGSAIASVEELLAHALAIETEAAQRYAELADQMEVHNNLEVAALFRKLAQIEGRHIEQVQALGAGADPPGASAWKHGWVHADVSEAPDYQDVHYLMQPHHAITLALRAEEHALQFFTAVAAQAGNEQLAAMARRLAAEEQAHIGLLEQWLADVPQPDANWDEDPDTPAITG
jgi:rubrerythrin